MDFQDQKVIENIFITHAHLDHIKAVAFFADNLVTRGANHTVFLYSDPEVIEILKRHLFNGLVWPDFSLIPSPDNPAIQYVSMEPETTVQLNKHRVTAYHVNHTTPAVGFLVENEEGKKVVYTGDTGPTEQPWHACDEHVLDGVIVEVSFPNRMTELAINTGHLTPDLLAREVLKMKNLPLRFFISHSKPSHMEEINNELAEMSREHIEILQNGQVIIL
ncbi:MAG: 3',5'-cyclic-nucleotide phosphodiesterase [bacterium]|nr:3',5'-cyclic-nucleotide phosphodiesterase [bacterium]